MNRPASGGWGHHPLDGKGPEVLGWEPRNLDLEGEPSADLGPGIESQRKKLPLKVVGIVPGQGYYPRATPSKNGQVSDLALDLDIGLSRCPETSSQPENLRRHLVEAANHQR